jgi:Pyruvate/2-oxoacid:ferredoxin oxidoreductase delta subunit
LGVLQKNIYYKTARTIAKAGAIPFPISDTLIKLLKILINEEQAEFVSSVFKKPSLNLDQIKENTNLDEKEIKRLLEELMDTGIIIGAESQRRGIMVYRLMSFFPGIFEFQFLRGGIGDREKKLAKLFDTLFSEMSEGTQRNYENIVNQFKNFPAIDRIVPVEQEIEEIPVDTILSSEKVSKIVDKFNDIALVHCYCRHEKDLLGESCRVTDERKNCLLFGKSAQFAIQYNFGERISKEEVREILSKAEDEGLIHKAFHVHSDVEREEEAICNCCKCCCGIFNLYYKGIMPYHCYTSYIAEVNEEECTACETCVERCPMEAIQISSKDFASVLSEKCIGCGVCAHACPQNSIDLKRTGLREVFVPPPKL